MNQEEIKNQAQNTIENQAKDALTQETQKQTDNVKNQASAYFNKETVFIVVLIVVLAILFLNWRKRKLNRKIKKLEKEFLELKKSLPKNKN